MEREDNIGDASMSTESQKKDRHHHRNIKKNHKMNKMNIESVYKP